MKIYEKFTHDSGIYFYNNGVSLNFLFFNMGKRMDEAQIRRVYSRIDNFLGAVLSIDMLSFSGSEPLHIIDFKPKDEEPFYKFISKDTWDNYIRNGVFQFGSLASYRDTENKNIQDKREGYTSFIFQSNEEQVNFIMRAGENCVVLCGTSIHNDINLMKDRFGEVLIRINNPQKFCRRTCSLIGARRYNIFDVKYSNYKIFVINNWEFVFEIKKSLISQSHEISMETFHEWNNKYFKYLHDIATLPSVFIKPTDYTVERERRIVFHLPKDIQEKFIRIKDKKLLLMIEKVA